MYAFRRVDCRSITPTSFCRWIIGTASSLRTASRAAEIAGVVADIAHQHRLAALSGGASDPLAECQCEVLDDLLTVSAGVADGERLAALAVKQDGEQFVTESPAG